MKVIVSAHSRFHSFELARQLQLRGHLYRMYTGYPGFKVREVDPTRVQSHWALSMAHHGAGRIGLHPVSRLMRVPAIVEYDRWVARHLEPCDAVVSLPTFCLDTFRAAHRLGTMAICDCASTHPLVQREILLEEYRRFGVDTDLLDFRTLDREVAAIEGADCITVPSTVALQSYVAQGIEPRKLSRIPYGVDLRMYKPLGKSDEVFRVLFVGQASLRKGVQYLLEATSQLRLPNFEVVFAGSVNDDVRNVLRKHAGRFKHVGVVPRPQLASVYSQASALVVPSVEEGLALVQAQAMACGLPVIATTHTGAEDLFTDGLEGFIVQPRDPDAIRDAIMRLYADPQLREDMGGRALACVQQLGGWDSYGTGIVAAYEAHLARFRSETGGLGADGEGSRSVLGNRKTPRIPEARADRA